MRRRPVAPLGVAVYDGAVRVLGFDEAGRGSVLGPLVVGAYLIGDADTDAVRAAGGRDSKALTPRRRATAADALKDLALAWRAVSVAPARIDAGNLNALEEEVFRDAVRDLRPDLVQIDAPVPSRHVDRFRRRMAAFLDLPLDAVVAANRAEDRFPAVGAASVLAKTTRDAAIAALAEVHGPIGSGYPADPATRAFLADLIERDEPLPDFVRARWSTVRDLLAARDLRRRQGTLF